MNIIYIIAKNTSPSSLKTIQTCLRKVNINTFDIHFLHMPEGCLRKRTKTKSETVPEKEPIFLAKLSVQKPDFIIINDSAALGYLTHGKYLSLSTCRGSIYTYTLDNRIIPCLVVDSLSKTKYTKTGTWILNQDIGKLKRWITGTVREEPKFNYTVVATRLELDKFKNFAENSIAIALDIETSIGHISCIGYTCLNKSRKVHTFVVPFISGDKQSGCYWDNDENEIYAWETIKSVHKSNAYKILQNGSYDCAWLLAYNIPLYNYICDTLHAHHSIWCELYKRLDFITSIASDTYTYWKDEGKEDAKEDTTKTTIPKTPAGMENYWRYNALDCHNTFISWRYLLSYLGHPKVVWALDNYCKEFQQQFGAAFAMTMRGVNYNKQILYSTVNKLQSESDLARKDLLTAADNIDFNPNSPKQLKEMLYQVFKLKPYKRKGETTDEKVLKMIKDQSIFASWFIDAVWNCKKPANNISKYATNISKYNRVLYKMCAGVTETARYAGRAHDFWCGLNMQNMPYIMRAMIEPDPGFVLYDIDYAQSDSYFVAFDMQDEQFMKTMLSDKDTHCIHTEFFFKTPYDKLIAAHKNHEDWVSHNINGIRSIAKKVSHGANYLMGGGTLFMTMGRDRTIQAAIALGYADAYSWVDDKLIKLCDAFLGSYFDMYPQILPSLRDKIQAAKAANNMAICYGGRTRMFFGDLEDNAIQRQFASFFGQGGTAENINKSLHKLYWSKEGRRLESQGHRMLFQVHDSLVGQVPIESVNTMIPQIQSMMENKCELHDRKFIVPTDAQIGLGWGKRMMDFKPGINWDDIKSHDDKWLQENI